MGQLNFLDKVFKLFDHDKDGELSAIEAKAAVMRLDMNGGTVDYQDGTDFADFLALVACMTPNTRSKDEFKETTGKSNSLPP